MGPHAAVMGVHFYTGNMFPAEYQNTLFVARKGSWNREKPFGFDVVTVRAARTARRAAAPFATGFRKPARATTSGAGRPTSRRCPTARCWCPTSRSARSTASATEPRRRPRRSSVFSLPRGAVGFLARRPFHFSRRAQERLQLCAACHGPDGNSINPADSLDRRAAEALPREPARPVPRGAAQVGADGSGGERLEGPRDRQARRAFLEAAGEGNGGR